MFYKELIDFQQHLLKEFYNKKVLLRECKSHTDRGVSSTTRARSDRGGT